MNLKTPSQLALERIAPLSGEKRHRAMRRLSRSWSVPESCVRDDDCYIDGDDVVWPDGERWPRDTAGGARAQRAAVPHVIQEGKADRSGSGLYGRLTGDELQAARSATQPLAAMTAEAPPDPLDLAVLIAGERGPEVVLDDAAAALVTAEDYKTLDSVLPRIGAKIRLLSARIDLVGGFHDAVAAAMLDVERRLEAARAERDEVREALADLRKRIQLALDCTSKPRKRPDAAT